MLIADGSHLLHRCMFVSPTIDWKMYAYIASRTLMNTIKHLHDKDVIICWDEWGSERRKKVYKEYKEREPLDLSTPEGRKRENELIHFVQARKWLYESMPKIGIQSMKVKGIEADDIAYFLVTEKLPSLEGSPTGINHLITEDRDWIQIVNEYWHLYRPISDEKITYKDFVDLYQTPERFVVMKALMGDKSDNIPKCYGMGERKVGEYADRIINNESIIDKSGLSQNLQEFISSGQFTKNIELIDFSLLGRGERRKLHIEYDESKRRVVPNPTIIDFVSLAEEIDSSNFINFGSYLQF